MTVRGHFGVAVCQPKLPVNVGGLVRSVNAFGGAYVDVIGHRYEGQASAVGHDQHLPVRQYDTLDAWLAAVPYDTDVVCIERGSGSVPLEEYTHPERAVYLLGPEDGDIPPAVASEHDMVEIPTTFCLNVATAGSVAIYDRVAKTLRAGTQRDAMDAFDVVVR